MGVGQPLSMKLKKVHLPHPHPNGGFSLGGGVVLLHIATLALGLSVVMTPSGVGVGDVSSGVVFLSLLGTSTERNALSEIIMTLFLVT